MNVFIQDIAASETEVSIGKVTVPFNPSSIDAVVAESLSIPSDSFCLNGSQAVKSYRLRFLVTNSRKSNGTSTSRPSTRSRESNSSDLGKFLQYFSWKVLPIHDVFQSNV